MNCINHPETPALNYCQNCGKPLCAECTRSVNGMVFCEPCLAARLGVPAAGTTAAGAVPGTATGNPLYPVSGRSPSPVLAAILGLIPGVGAMYNGQFLKGIVHVVVFIALIGATDHFGPFGLLIAAWVFYQVFDAYQTAHAIQFGLPLPDPLGLNNIGAKLGIGQPAAYPYVGTPPAAAPPTAAAPAQWTEPPAASGFAPSTPYAGYSQPVPPVPPVPHYDAAGNPVAADPNPAPGAPAAFDQAVFDPGASRSLPVGAVILIALGAIFLLGTIGILNEHWLHHGWPLIIIAVGVWLFYKNSRSYQGGPK
jgi:TM2 domain-containing membrane protein YozV